MRENVLRHLPGNENSVTTLLRALCALKPIREVVARLFTAGGFGADDIPFEGISTQYAIGGPIPDMCWQGDDVCVVAEIKVSAWRGFTDNQPRSYLDWLAKQPIAHKYFVLLVPPQYAQEHRRDYNNRKADFCAANPNHTVRFIEIDWLALGSALDQAGLVSACAYACDFQDLLEGWFAADPIRFTSAELRATDMFNSTAADALSKMMDFVEEMEKTLALAFEGSDAMSIRRNFDKRWWKGEYTISVKCGNRSVLFLGVWTAFWKDHGFPLCVGVNAGESDSGIIQRFRQAFPSSVLYTSPASGIRYWTTGIDQHLLMDDAVRDVSDSLLQGYLKNICKLADGTRPATDNLLGALESTG